jgi:hypothetical protein
LVLQLLLHLHHLQFLNAIDLLFLAAELLLKLQSQSLHLLLVLPNGHLEAIASLSTQFQLLQQVLILLGKVLVLDTQIADYMLGLQHFPQDLFESLLCLALLCL